MLITKGTSNLLPEETIAVETATSLIAVEEMGDKRSLPASGRKQLYNVSNSESPECTATGSCIESKEG